MTAPIRIATWNVNHRTVQKRIPASMADAVAALDADVVMLTEWVPGPSRLPFLDGLRARGLVHTAQSAVVLRQNHVLVASRWPVKAGDIFAPAIDASLPSNVLHVRVPALGIEVLGMRVPDHSRDRPKQRACWDWIESIAAAVRGRRIIMLGDFNADPADPPSRCGDPFARLVAAGWQHALPVDGASYWSLNGAGRRLDHAFVSPALIVVGAQYMPSIAPHRYAGKVGSLSDHAPLVVDITR